MPHGCFVVTDFGLQARSDIRELLAAHDHRPQKSFGQNFLADPNIVDRIVRTAGVDESTNVIEIGAGTGALTTALAREAGRVVAYEVDHALEPLLRSAVDHHANVELRFADASRLRFDRALPTGDWTLVANLPYNVGTGIVLDILQHAPMVTRLVVMVQKEVADRLVSGPGGKVYGIPSVVVGLHGTAHIAFTVPPHVFEPAPNVDSAVVVIDREPADTHASRAIEIATTAFGQRRKMLRKSLAAELTSVGVLELAGIDPTDRPEDLPPEAFVAIAVAEDQT
jgi:16S rRNA (adenine1518-N6/adenine1519-N6)-dimethyltransferase